MSLGCLREKNLGVLLDLRRKQGRAQELPEEWQRKPEHDPSIDCADRKGLPVGQAETVSFTQVQVLNILVVLVLLNAVQEVRLPVGGASF